jgi:hypothetical protein
LFCALNLAATTGMRVFVLSFPVWLVASGKEKSAAGRSVHLVVNAGFVFVHVAVASRLRS